MNKFTIKRSEWLRGNPKDATLLDHNNMKCCLGFFSLACGISPENIRYLENPSVVISCPTNKESPNLYPDWVLDGTLNSQNINDLIKVNDNSSFPDDSFRERTIKEIFAKHNITVEFED